MYPIAVEDLLNAVKALHAVPDTGQVAKRIVRHCSSLLPLRAVAVLLWRPESRSFALAATFPEVLDQALGAAVERLLRDPGAGANPMLLPEESAAGLVTAPLPGSEEQPIGLLIIEPVASAAWDRAAQEMAQELAAHAGIALQNAQLVASKDAALHEQMIELSTIEVVSQQLAAALDPGQVAAEVLAAAITATGALRGRCVLIGETDEPVIAAEYGVEDGANQAGFCRALPDQDHSVVGHVLSARQPLLIPDVAALAGRPADVPPEIRSVLAVPILREATPIGVLSLEDPRVGAFGAGQRRLVALLAEHAGTAIENARLYQQVRLGRDQLQAILDSTDEALLLFDRHGRLLRFNPAAEAMAGLALSEFLGQGPACWVRALGMERLQSMAGLTPQQLRETVRAVEANPGAVEHRTFAQKAGDRQRYIAERRSPVLDREGQIVGWLMIWRDTTEAHQLDLLRLDLSAMIVHDLRNPITAISSSLMMLRDLILEGESDVKLLLEVVDIASSSASYMFNLVQSILDVGRLEHNHLALEYESGTLQDCVDYALKSVFSQALTAEIVLSVDLPPELPPAWIDADKIQRVLINLLDNALRHTPQHGHVQITATPDAAAGMIIVRVDDTGPGVPPEARTRIFDKFTQLDHQVLRGHKGTGLGLTFCRLAVEAHGGRIWVEDAPAGGASFRFTVPMAPAAMHSADE